MEPNAEARLQLKTLVTRRRLRAVHWATEPEHPSRPGPASLTGDYPRLLLGLQATRHVWITRGGEARPLALAAGHCLVMGPHTWLVTRPSQDFLSAGVVLEARHPRLVLTRGARAQVQILPGLCDDPTMALAAALLAAGSEAADDPYACRLAEALWIRIVRFRPPARPADAGAKAHVTYSAAEHFVRDNFGRPIDRDDVARFLRIHPSHVTRLFLRFAGESFGGYLLRVRLESARRLLADPRWTVSEAAYLAGFSSPNYFVRAYRQRYQVTPGRDRMRSKCYECDPVPMNGARRRE